MKDIRIYLVILFFIMGCNNSQKKDNETFQINDLNGIWKTSSNKYFFFNDSLCLDQYFCPLTKYKTVSDTLFVYVSGSENLKNSWVSYKIYKSTSDSLVLKGLDFDQVKRTYYKNSISNVKPYDSINLIGTSAPTDDKFFEYKVNLKSGLIIWSNFENIHSPEIKKCKFNKHELLLIDSILNQIDFSNLKKEYYSNRMEAIYYHLELYSSKRDNKVSVWLDNGQAAPNSIKFLVTYLWATVKLKCSPENYTETISFP